MGISGGSKVKTTQTTKPIYSGQIEGAANTITNAYNQAQPNIVKVSDNLTNLSQSLLDRYTQGDPTIDAARNYINTTLEGDPASNPYLDEMVSLSNDNVRNQLQAKLGTRGLTGSSDYYDMIGKGLAANETGLRYTDYNNAMARRAQAAGMAPGVVAGDYLPVAAAMESGSQGALLPLAAANQYGAGVGGLLGQYTNQTGTQKQSGGFGNLLGGLLGAGLSGWATGGFKI